MHAPMPKFIGCITSRSRTERKTYSMSARDIKLFNIPLFYFTIIKNSCHAWFFIMPILKADFQTGAENIQITTNESRKLFCLLFHGSLDVSGGAVAQQLGRWACWLESWFET